MTMTQGTSFLEQSCLSFHCHTCCFISRSEVKFPSGIIVVEILNSSYVVLVVKMFIYMENCLFPEFF